MKSWKKRVIPSRTRSSSIEGLTLGKSHRSQRINHDNSGRDLNQWLSLFAEPPRAYKILHGSEQGAIKFSACLSNCKLWNYNWKWRPARYHIGDSNWRLLVDWNELSAGCLTRGGQTPLNVYVSPFSARRLITMVNHTKPVAPVVSDKFDWLLLIC